MLPCCCHNTLLLPGLCARSLEQLKPPAPHTRACFCPLSCLAFAQPSRVSRRSPRGSTHHATFTRRCAALALTALPSLSRAFGLAAVAGERSPRPAASCRCAARLPRPRLRSGRCGGRAQAPLLQGVARPSRAAPAGCRLAAPRVLLYFN